MLARRASLIGYAVTLLLCCAAAHATNRVVVNTTADDFGLDATHCSLREALYTLNQKQNFGGCTIVAGSLFDSVSLPAGTFVTTRAPVLGNSFAGGALVIGQNIVVIGAGAGKTIIDGGSLDAVFSSDPGPGLAGVVDTTIRNGRSDQYNGSGIRHQNGQLLLQRVVVTQNQGGYAVYSVDAAGVNVNQTTISNNAAVGMLIESPSTSSTVSIINTTVSGNASADYTGGLFIEANQGVPVTANISNSTIAYNTSHDQDSSGLVVAGDGITLYLRNSIIANNIRGVRYLDDCETGEPTLISQGYNIIGYEGVCPFQGDTAHDIIGIEPQLAPLWDYGSGVPTHAVFAGSIAFHAGNPATPGSGGAACESVDARGVARGTNGRCDIGAYEYHADYVVNTTQDIGDPTIDDGICTTSSQCSLRKAIQQANDSTTFTTIELPAGDIAIQKPDTNGFNIDGAFYIFTLNAVTLVGKGAGLTTLDGGGFDTTLRSGYMSTSTAIHGVTIRNGNSGVLGGGVRVEAGSLLLDHSRVTSNIAEGGNGIDVAPGTLVEIDASTIDHNRSLQGLQSFGGGILAQGSVRLLNATVADNFALQSGGGIYNLSGDVSMAFTTVAGNTVPDGAPGAGLGGSGGFWHATNSIIAGNAQVNGAARTESDCAVDLQLQGYTFIQSLDGCTVGGTASYAASGTDAKLSSLAQQGGATPTIGPEPGSPVIGLITSEAQCSDLSGNQILADQRDIARPLFSNWGNPDRCTIGAFQGVSDVIFADAFE